MNEFGGSVGHLYGMLTRDKPKSDIDVKLIIFTVRLSFLVKCYDKGVATIYEIAEKAGVPPKTAARILSGETKRSKKKDIVLEWAAKLGYVPNAPCGICPSGNCHRSYVPAPSNDRGSLIPVFCPHTEPEWTGRFAQSRCPTNPLGYDSTDREQRPPESGSFPAPSRADRKRAPSSGVDARHRSPAG